MVAGWQIQINLDRVLRVLWGRWLCVALFSAKLLFGCHGGTGGYRYLNCICRQSGLVSMLIFD